MSVIKIKLSNFHTHNLNTKLSIRNKFYFTMSTFGKYFNSTTIRGRANSAKATYASFAALYLYYRFRKKDHKTEDHHIEHKENGHSGKDLDRESHEHTHDPKTEPEASCPCKCDENAQSSNGHVQSNDKSHNGGNGHQSNDGHHDDHSADGANSNPSNHGHQNGTKAQKPDSDNHNTHGKSADNVNYNHSQSLESSNPLPNEKAAEKTFFSCMDDSVITWGLP